MSESNVDPRSHCAAPWLGDARRPESTGCRIYLNSWIRDGFHKVFGPHSERSWSVSLRRLFERTIAGWRTRSLALARDDGCERIVELGAGTARISCLIAMDSRSQGLMLIPCDYNPDVSTYARIKRQFPDKVFPSLEPVDFSKPQSWPEKTMLVLSATLHHVPSQKRKQVIRLMTESADRVVVFEPFRRTFSSFLYAFPSIVPSFIFPLVSIRKPGTWRRVFWCWLVPVAPFMFCWDGIVSVLRQWDERTWRHSLSSILGRNDNPRIHETRFCQMVTWVGERQPKKKDETAAPSTIEV